MFVQNNGNPVHEDSILAPCYVCNAWVLYHHDSNFVCLYCNMAMCDNCRRIGCFRCANDGNRRCCGSCCENSFNNKIDRIMGRSIEHYDPLNEFNDPDEDDSDDFSDGGITPGSFDDNEKSFDSIENNARIVNGNLTSPDPITKKRKLDGSFLTEDSDSSMAQNKGIKKKRKMNLSDNNKC